MLGTNVNAKCVLFASFVLIYIALFLLFVIDHQQAQNVILVAVLLVYF